MSSTTEIKNQITEYLRLNVDGAEDACVIDVFKYVDGRSYQLTHYGFKKLSKVYEFHEIEICFDGSLIEYATIDGMITSLYYITVRSREKTAKINTTDKKFVNLMKLYKYDIKVMVEKFKKGRVTK